MDQDIVKATKICSENNLSNIAYAVKTPESYYDSLLETRLELINKSLLNNREPSQPLLAGIDRLCKTIVYENTRCPESLRYPYFSRYYLVLVQYNRRFSSSKFYSHLRTLIQDAAKANNLAKGIKKSKNQSAVTLKDGETKEDYMLRSEEDCYNVVCKKNYTFAFACDEIAEKLTGAAPNGIGIVCSNDHDIPIVIDQHIIDCLTDDNSYVSMGGFHPQVKLIVDIKKLLEIPEYKKRIMILDITNEDEQQ